MWNLFMNLTLFLTKISHAALKNLDMRNGSSKWTSDFQWHWKYSIKEYSYLGQHEIWGIVVITLILHGPKEWGIGGSSSFTLWGC